jgi:ABC-2 type transport system permease protein
MIGAVVVTTAVAASTVIALIAFDQPIPGSVAFGASMVGVGTVFAGVAAVTAQVASGARAALAAGGLAIGLAFVLRAVGDVGNGVLSWASPIGWAQAIRPYADERWWVLLLPLLTSGALLVGARALQDHRDYGSGLVAPRAGRREATASLSTTFGLALRLQRGALTGWAVGLGALGFFYGLVADQAEQIIEDNPDMAEFFAQLGVASVTDAFLSTAVLIMALFATGFAVSSVLRLRTEEVAGRADPVLAAPIRRRRWAASHLAVALVGTIVLAAVTGAAMGLGAAIVLGEAGRIGELLGAGLVMVPAMWLLSGFTALLYGVRARWAVAAWAVVAWVFVAALFGSVLDLPRWALNASPFQHVPALPAASMSWLPLVVLTVLAVVSIAGALTALDRRDLA